MSEFSFEWQGTGSLGAALKQPIRDAAILVVHGTANVVKLWREDGTALAIYSRMHDVGPREEVGVLAFVPTIESSVDDRRFAFSAKFVGVSEVTKLTIQASPTITAESGVIITLDGGHELVILAAAFPCSLAISGVPGWIAEFRPEWELDKYVRSPI